MSAEHALDRISLLQDRSTSFHPAWSPFGLWRILETSAIHGTATWLNDGRVDDSLTSELASLALGTQVSSYPLPGHVLSIIMKGVRDASVPTEDSASLQAPPPPSLSVSIPNMRR